MHRHFVFSLEFLTYSAGHIISQKGGLEYWVLLHFLEDTLLRGTFINVQGQHLPCMYSTLNYDVNLCQMLEWVKNNCKKTKFTINIIWRCSPRTVITNISTSKKLGVGAHKIFYNFCPALHYILAELCSLYCHISIRRLKSAIFSVTVIVLQLLCSGKPLSSF